MTRNIEAAAHDFAAHYHGIIDQRRKYTNDPYIVHPAAVVEIVKTIPHTPEMVAAAWLHDVVEDTPATLDEVRATFGRHVASLVEMLTNVSRPGDGGRAARKVADRAHLAMASAEAKTIKLADVIDNTRNIATLDPKFARIYLVEKSQLLRVLRDGEPVLWFRADALIAKACAALAPNGGARGEGKAEKTEITKSEGRAAFRASACTPGHTWLEKEAEHE